MDNHEINRRMAEAMGWPAYIGKQWDDMKDIDFVFPCVIIWSEQICYHSDNPHWSSDWNPAEDLNQAIKVAEELRKRDPDNNYWELVSPFKPVPWSLHKTAHLFHGIMMVEGSRGHGTKDTPALALCEAVKAAVKEASC